MRASKILLAAGVACAGGCTERLLDDASSQGDGGAVGEPGEGPDSVDAGEVEDEPERPPPQLVQRLPPDGVDILVVVDNSGSMGEEQGKLSLALEDLARGLAETEGLDFRIAFTTTDNGNPWCESGDTGQLFLSSCRERLDAFVSIADPNLDSSEEGCLDVCDLAEVSADVPWLERIDGIPNVPELTEAIACAAPQGIAGCGHEQPLEAMRKALLRTGLPEDPAYGLLRPDAALAVILLTDEVDCSYAPDAESIFDPYLSAFWDGDGLPTSAVCWRAGVACTGDDPDAWDECHPQDYALDGMPTDDPSAAVLHPVQRYVDALAAIDDLKAPYLVDPAVQVVLVAGVPLGFQAGNVDVAFVREGPDDFVETFGIGPGCQSDSGLATPPVRLHALAEAFPGPAGDNVSSVCQVGYDPALSPILDRVLAPDDPPCYPGCPVDVDDQTPGLQVSCTVTEQRGTPQGRISEAIPACDEGEAGAPACWIARTETARSPACIAEDAALEIEVVRAVAAPGGTTVFATCTPC